MRRGSIFFVALLLAALWGGRGVLRTRAQDATAVPPPGTVISDDFSDPSHGIFPTSSSNPAYQEGYVDGEYQLARSGPQAPSNPTVTVPGSFSDVTVDVDARVVGNPAHMAILVFCRRAASVISGYYLYVAISGGMFAIVRGDGKTLAALAPGQRSDAILTGNQANHLELSCIGRTISASASGSPLGSAQDTQYGEGQVAIEAGSAAPRPTVK